MRIALGIAAAALTLAGCKKQPKPGDETPAPGPTGQVGHAKMHSHGSNGSGGDDSDATPSSGGSGQAAAPVDAQDDSGGTPAYRDEDGHIHGPGGGVDMGEGPACDASRNHCLRKPALFAASEIERGHQFRATPTFKFEKDWYDWRGQPIDKGGKIYDTAPVGNNSLSPGAKVIFFESDADEAGKWADSEYDALTSSRWEAGIVESVSGATVRVSGWGDTPKDTVRLITGAQSN